MKAIKIFTLTILIVNLFVSFGCKCSRTDNEFSDIENSQIDSTYQPEEINEILIPSPIEVIEVISSSGFSYDPSILSKLGIEKKALLFKHKSLLLGVYVSDFAYASVFNDREISTQYFNAIQSLTKDLGINSVLNDAYYKRFENNINNYDSIDLIFKDFSTNAYNTLIETGNKEILSMIAIGSVVELLYIGLNSIEFNEHNQDVISRILEHKAIFENYYKNFILYNKEKEEFKSLIEDLDKIYSFFITKVSSEDHTVVATDMKNHFIIKDVTKSNISKKDLQDLYELIEASRTKMLELKY